MDINWTAREKKYSNQAQYRLQDNCLYDSTDIAAAGSATRFNLFAPKSGTNRYETNLVKDGALSGQNAFRVLGMRFVPEPGQGQPDIQALVRGYARVHINQQTDLQHFHLFDMPSGSGIYATADGAAAAVTYANNGAPHITNALKLRAPWIIEPDEAFGMELVYQAAPSLTAQIKVFGKLDGVEYVPRR